MKILYTSDLHVDISENNRKIIDCLVEYVIIQKPDLFIIAGDLANSSKDINDSLKRFKFIDCKKYLFLEIMIFGLNPKVN